MTAAPFSLEGKPGRTKPNGAAKAAQIAFDWGACVQPASVEWYTTKPSPREWLLRDKRTDAGVLPRARVGLLVAEGGAGKTLALCQLAVSLATGVPWLGVFDVPQTGRTLLVLGEETSEECHRRLYQAVQAMKCAAPAAGVIDVCRSRAWSVGCSR